MKARAKRKGTTMKLTAYNECNDREIEAMVGKAMCAFANAREMFKLPYTDPRFRHETQDEVVSSLMAEYEATVRCIDLFVRESLYEIQSYVSGRAKTEFGI